MIYDKNYVYGDQNVQIPAHLNFGKYIYDKIKLWTDEVALENHTTGEKLTYKQLTQNAVNLSIALTKLGVGRGDVIALGTEKRNELLIAVFGIIFSGATCTIYDIDSGRSSLKHKLNLSQPKYFIVSNLFWNTYSNILKSFNCTKQYFTFDDALESLISIKALLSNDLDINRFEPAMVHGQTDTAVIFYSSGTTGMPKGVQLTHLNCILHNTPDEFKESLKIAYVYGEWYLTYDFFMTCQMWLAGRKIVYANDIKAQTFIKCLKESSVDVAFLVPSYMTILSKLQEHEDLDSLRCVYSVGSPLHGNTIRAVKQKFPKLKEVLQRYGTTETSKTTSEEFGVKGPKDGSVGVACPGAIIKVVDIESRETLGPNQNGEICIKGPIVMKGYIGVDPYTYLDEQGFFKTGDLGYYDDDKYFYIIDRLQDIIEYHGYKVPPLELEVILQSHPGVREAGVVGIPVSAGGEIITACVVKQPGYDVTEAELVDFVALEVPSYMQLKGGIRFIDEIPRNVLGKVLRRPLRELVQDSLINNIPSVSL